MTLLKERGRSDDNDARAFLLSNTAEERVELLWDRRCVDLISDALPFGRLLYGEPNAVSNAIGYAEHFSRSHDGVIRVYDENPNPKKATKTSDIFVLIVSIGPLRFTPSLAAAVGGF
jgi:hypothetical protein